MIMDRQITIVWETVKNAVNRHLSIIGKRATDKNGESLFSGITLSSIEDDIFLQYINAAAETFVGELSPMVTAYDSGDTLTITISSHRWSNGHSIAFEGNFMGFVVSYVANAILGMNYPEYAKKYADDMRNHISAALKLVYTNQAPSVSSAKYEEVKGIVEISNNESRIGF